MENDQIVIIGSGNAGRIAARTIEEIGHEVKIHEVNRLFNDQVYLIQKLPEPELMNNNIRGCIGRRHRYTERKNKKGNIIHSEWKCNCGKTL